MLKLLLALLLSFTVKGAFAACSSPAGVTGIMQYISGEYKYCDNTNWNSLSVTNLGTSCSSTGLWQRSGSDSVFCNGTNWISMVGNLTDGTCSSAGMIQYDALNFRLRWCDGTNWKIMQPSASLSLPTNLAIFFNPNEQGIAMEWSPGTLTDPCNIQYEKDGTTWTTFGGPFDCNDYMVTGFINLPLTDYWTNNYNATGVKLRLVSSVSGNSYGEFPQRVTCVIRPNPGSPTPLIDENCDGAWNDEPDPCESSPSPGTVCSDGSVYVTTVAGVKYFTTKGGCGDIPADQKVGTGFPSYPSGEFTPTCSGNDSLQKSWDNYTGSWYDFPELVNYSTTAGIGNEAINIDANTGAQNTSVLAARSTLPGGIHAAARYCENLKIGNKTDWFIPNRFELNHMRVNRAAMPGILAAGYWTSTEYNDQGAWFQMMGTGEQDFDYKGSGYYLRCMRREVLPDPCLSSPDPGTSCAGGAIYAGDFSGRSYFVTPGGCAADGSSCSGNDTANFTWRGTSGTNTDIPGITNITTASNQSLQLGEDTTLAMINSSSVSANSAAYYCSNLNYGGHTDWYLPAKSELSFIYCKMSGVTFAANKPEDAPNCTLHGGKTSVLTGFSTATGSYYWSSTEAASTSAWTLRPNTGVQGMTAKNISYFARCVRSSAISDGTVHPTSLSVNHSSGNKNFSVSWTAGSGQNGAGGCKLQYFKDGNTWTDLAGTYNCDANATNVAATLPATAGWTNSSGNWDATGVSIRLQRVSDSAGIGLFSNTLKCSSRAGSSSPTPNLDEDCDRNWDDYGFQSAGTCLNNASTKQVGATYTCTQPASCSGYTALEFSSVTFSVQGYYGGYPMGTDTNWYTDTNCTTGLQTGQGEIDMYNSYSITGTVPASGSNGRYMDGSCYALGGASRKKVSNVGYWPQGECAWDYGENFYK